MRRARFPPARGNQAARPRAPERELSTARPRDDQPGGSQPRISNPEAVRPSVPPAAGDRLRSRSTSQGDGYPFADRDLGCVQRPALATEQASERGKSSRPEWFRYQASPNNSQKQIVPLQCRCFSPFRGPLACRRRRSAESRPTEAVVPDTGPSSPPVSAVRGMPNRRSPKFTYPAAVAIHGR